MENKENKKIKRIPSTQVSEITGVPVRSLIIAIELGLIEGEIQSQRTLFYETEIEKINQLKDVLSEDNLIYGASQLGNILPQFGGKKSWSKELSPLLPDTKAFLGYINTVIHRKPVKVPVFSKKDIPVGIIIDFIDKKMKEIKESRKRGRVKAKETRKYIEKLKEEQSQYMEILKTIHPFLEIAYYLYHLNHYAKTPKYQKQSNQLYDLKKKVLLKALEKYPELIKTKFIERGDKIIYCKDCIEEAIDLRDLLDARGPWIDFVDGPCPKCKVIKDYYSLIEFYIESPIAKFTFHLPYPIVPHLKTKNIEIEKRYTEDGIFDNYGRPINKLEESLFPLRKVIEKLNEFLKNQ
jgi:hypothetical protein